LAVAEFYLSDSKKAKAVYIHGGCAVKKNPKREMNYLLYGCSFDEDDPLSFILGLLGWFVIICIIFGWS